MGDVLTEEKPKEQNTFSKIFREVFPHYLAIGMPAEEFWDGDSWLVKAYRDAYRIRSENEYKEADHRAWLTGVYIQRALAATPLVVNGFVPKGHHMKDYPNRPMSMEQEERDRKATQKKQEENKQQMAQAMFQAFTEKMNRNIKRRLEREKAEKS